MQRTSRRNEMNQQNNSKSAESALPPLKSVARLSRIPVIETGWQFVADLYIRVKKSNSLVNWGLGTAESSVYIALGHTMPAVAVLERPISLLDSLLCKSIDMVEKRVPMVNLPPELIYMNTKDYVSNTLVRPVLKRADSVKQFSLHQANTIMASKYSNFAAYRLDSALDVADKYVDQYLPSEADAPEDMNMNNIGGTKAVQTIHRVDRFSRKLQRRLTQRTLAEAKALKMQSENLLHVVLYTVELLAKDPKAVMSKAAALWEHLSKDEPGNQARPANLDQLIVMVSREMARRVVHLVNATRSGFATLPHHITVSMHRATEFCTQLADTLIKTAHLEGVKEKAIVQAKVQVVMIQQMLKEMNVYTNQLLEKLGENIAGREAKPTNNVNNIHAEPNKLNAVD